MKDVQTPDPNDFADIAEVADARVAEKTGRNWAEWVSLLDDAGAVEWTHKKTAAHLREVHDVGLWWCQTLTVGYERIRGLRAKGQLCTGDFAASKSKTFPVAVGRLYTVFRDERAAWMECETVVRTASEGRSIRLTWPDGTIVSGWFTDKGPHKSSVAIQHDKLDTAERREFEKAAWGQRLRALGERL